MRKQPGVGVLTHADGEAQLQANLGLHFANSCTDSTLQAQFQCKHTRRTAK